MRQPLSHDAGFQPSYKSHARHSGGCKNLDCQTRPTPTDSGTCGNQIQPEVVTPHNYEHKKLCACITHFSDILSLLVSEQPVSAQDLTPLLGFSKPRVLKDLTRLMKYDLVKRVSFEHHVLYCINGEFNSVIFEVLDL